MTSPSFATEFKLKSGLILPNRIAKAATTEKLASKRGAPTKALRRLYERWSEGGAGLVITGNVIVSSEGREAIGNVVVHEEERFYEWRAWAEAGQRYGNPLFVQLNHAGRQSPFNATPVPVAPSAVPIKRRFRAFIAPPRALESRDIERITDDFVRGAAIARDAGFKGVQIHAAHGYLISQFLSPRTNQRTDRWGGTADARMAFLLEIVRRVRAEVGESYPIAVKLNSADFQRGGFTEEESMRVAQALSAEGIDLLEISGGNYESPAMTEGHAASASTRAREAYFLEYAQKLRQKVKMPLMLTGGFRSASAMNQAIESGACDLIGMARPLIVEPELPLRLLRGEAERATYPDAHVQPKLLNDMLQVLWYGRQIQRLAEGKAPETDLNAWRTLTREGRRAYGYNPMSRLARRHRSAARQGD